MERVTVRAGLLEVDVVPGVGGSIARFDRQGVDGLQPLFRRAPAGYHDVLSAACFPLVPFANRIRGGRFGCDGRTIALAPNMPGDPSPLHGQGWRSPWTIEDVTPATVRLGYDHVADAWPWSYRATQVISLSPDALTIELRCLNTSRSASAMPCGLGLHPYYPCDGRTILDCTVESAWTVDEFVLPLAKVPAIGTYDLRNRRVCGQRLDNGFDGWDGRATITWAGMPASLQLSCDDATRFQLYSPASGGFFVGEPVQNANTALNALQTQWRELGIVRLKAGEHMSLKATFTVVA